MFDIPLVHVYSFMYQQLQISKSRIKLLLKFGFRLKGPVHIFQQDSVTPCNSDIELEIGYCWGYYECLPVRDGRVVISQSN